jgi:carboxypeptidase Taq
MFFEMAALCPKYFSLAAPMIRMAAGASSRDRGFSAENMFRLATYPVPSELTTWGASDFAHLPQMAWRIRAERRILDGDMEVADIAPFRAATLAKFTGLPEAHFSDIADIFDTSHWAGEEYGYFPAYVFGAAAAAQLREKLLRERGAEIAAAQSLADYLRIHYEFMNEHIYRHASLYKPRDLLARALGEKISIDANLRRLERNPDFTENGL